jgi:hypothetical protein
MPCFLELAKGLIFADKVLILSDKGLILEHREFALPERSGMRVPEGCNRGRTAYADMTGWSAATGKGKEAVRFAAWVRRDRKETQRYSTRHDFMNFFGIDRGG